MIRSMTGFGQSSAGIDGFRVTVEVRSVNHRFADVRLRLPDGLSALEADLRRRVLERIQRGRVEMDVRVERSSAGSSPAVLNRAVVDGLVAVARTLRDDYGVEGALDLGAVLAVPGVIQWEAPRLTLSEGGQKAVQDAVEGALRSVDADRTREGASLAADLLERLSRMQSLVGEISGLAPRVPDTLRRRITERLAGVTPGFEIDPQRLAQEAAPLADRSDVTEELVRLGGHLEQARELLRQADGEPVGKRLDFLLQEIHRETNTITSKSQDLEISRRALDLKAETEKVREQVQNLE
jgi:uncharacterized protein (TIGR00255 family)